MINARDYLSKKGTGSKIGVGIHADGTITFNGILQEGT